MRKFAKISLAAAVAVAGISSVASAKPLEEAIKGVDATGYVTYQYNDRNTKSAPTGVASTQQTTTGNSYKAGLTLTIPATDEVKVKVAGSARTNLNQANNIAGGTKTADAGVATNLTHAQFIYTGVENLTVIAGKQALSTPWTQGSSTIDGTQFGTGVLALYNAGFATLAGGYITNNNISGVDIVDVGDIAGATGTVNVTDAKLYVAAAIIPMADIATAQIWYADLSKLGVDNAVLGYVPVSSGADALSVSLDVNLMDVANLSLAHSTMDISRAAHTVLPVTDNVFKKQKLSKVVVSGTAGPVNLAAGYGKTGTNGGVVAFDNDASANFLGWDVGLNGLDDAKAYLLSANMDVMPSLNVGLTYVSAKQAASANGAGNNAANATANGTAKIKETYATATYTFADNLYATVMLGQDSMKDNTGKWDTDKGRLEIGFKF